MTKSQSRDRRVLAPTAHARLLPAQRPEPGRRRERPLSQEPVTSAGPEQAWASQCGGRAQPTPWVSSPSLVLPSCSRSPDPLRHPVPRQKFPGLCLGDWDPPGLDPGSATSMEGAAEAQ